MCVFRAGVVGTHPRFLAGVVVTGCCAIIRTKCRPATTQIATADAEQIDPKGGSAPPPAAPDGTPSIEVGRMSSAQHGVPGRAGVFRIAHVDDSYGVNEAEGGGHEGTPCGLGGRVDEAAVVAWN